MITSSLNQVPAELAHERDLIADSAVQRPMPLQDFADCHGHDMHPQKFIQLVGCHESNGSGHKASHRLH